MNKFESLRRAENCEMFREKFVFIDSFDNLCKQEFDSFEKSICMKFLVICLWITLGNFREGLTLLFVDHVAATTSTNFEVIARQLETSELCSWLWSLCGLFETGFFFNAQTSSGTEAAEQHFCCLSVSLKIFEKYRNEVRRVEKYWNAVQQ